MLPFIFLGVFISLKCFPFNPVVYFDEQTYLLSSQNLIENKVNAICNTHDEGSCLQYSVPAHGIGIFTLYSFFYDYDFERFYVTASIFVLVMYVMNAILVFCLASLLFSGKIIKWISFILSVFYPYNLIYSTNIMPATLTNTFLIISLIALVLLIRFKYDNLYLYLLLVVSLMLVSSFRVEYCLILSLALIYIFFKFKNKKTIDRILNSHVKTIALLTMFSGIILLYLYFLFYIKQKLFSGGGAYFGLTYLNMTYMIFFMKNPVFIFLTTCFFISVLGIFLNKEEDKQNIKLKFLILGIFLFYIILYTFYNHPDVFRFIIPVSSIYLIFSSAGMYSLFRLFIKNKKIVYIALIISLSLISVCFVNSSFKEKQVLLTQTKYHKYFLDLISGEKLDALLPGYNGDSYLFFKASYLGQIKRIKNFFYDYSLAIEKLKSGKKIYYINTVFESVENSFFNNTKKFDYELVYKEPNYNYRIYEIKLKPGEK
ncbi:hypothetical protein JXB41_03310 [Candidatus Woesearchaeota archaeon]|nr:hypothetical protein [Candidatus Woesearchaeota archaeon]